MKTESTLRDDHLWCGIIPGTCLTWPAGNVWPLTRNCERSRLRR